MKNSSQSSSKILFQLKKILEDERLKELLSNITLQESPINGWVCLGNAHFSLNGGFANMFYKYLRDYILSYFNTSIMKVKVINKSNNQLPKYETPGAAGLDLRASFKYVTPETPLKTFGDTEIIFGDNNRKTLFRLEPGARAIIPTDMYITVPKGHFCAIYPRSGLSIKQGLGLANSVGVLDEDYTGNMGIPVINNGFETIWIEDGERIAQMIIQPYVKINWEEVDSLEKTERNPEGFGSTNLDENGNYIISK